MSKHTPGPWTVEIDGDLAISVQPIGTVVKVYAHLVMVGEKEQDLANARLIACAPELLEAVKTFLETINTMDEVIKANLKDMAIDGSVFDLRRAKAQVERLIAKAEGETP